MIDGGEPTGRRIAKQRVLPIRFLLGLVVVGLVVMWFYAFFLAPSGNPDRMRDRTWPSAAELRCAVARDTITALPTARHSNSPAERAAVIDEATRVLSELVSDLGSLAGGSDNDLELVKRWLDDWGVYLTDRKTHANRLRAEGDVQPLLTALPDGSSMLERMNGFARVNSMDSCLDPGDF